jgi:GTPase
MNLGVTGPANVTLSLPSSWVNQHGGKESVYISRISDTTGMTEVISTIYTGTDAKGNMVFRGDSPNGSSIFGMITAKATALKQQEHPGDPIQLIAPC